MERKVDEMMMFVPQQVTVFYMKYELA